MAQPSPALLDTLDIVFLGTIGLGTIAWFARRQIAEKIFGSKEQDANGKLNGNGTAATAPKRERNFVKVMEEQVINLQKKKTWKKVMCNRNIYIYVCVCV